MAKTTTAPAAKGNSSPFLLAPFAFIHWTKKHNAREEYGDTKALQESLAQRGWVDLNTILVCPIQTDKDLSENDKAAGVKSEQAIALEERETLWTTLKSSSSPDKLVERAVFERLFVKDGKLIVPQYSGNAGFRRASVFFNAMVDRFKDTDVEDSEKIKDAIPVLVRDYRDANGRPDEGMRIVDQQIENEMQGIGTKSLSDKEKLRITKKLYDMGKRQVYIRQLYKSTTGQKLWNLVLADAYWPNLSIYERCQRDDKDADQIPLSKVRQDQLAKFNNRFEADEKRKAKKELSERELSMEPVKEQEVADYLNSLRAGGPPTPRPLMKRPDIEAQAKQNVIQWFRLPMTAVLDSSIEGMTKYLPHADALNLHKQLIDEGRGDVSLTALKLVSAHPQVISLMRDALALLTVDELVASVRATVSGKQKATAVNGSGN